MTRIIEEQFRAYIPTDGVLKIKKIDFINKMVDLENINVVNHRIKNPILLMNTSRRIGVTPLFEGDIFERKGSGKKYLIYYDKHSARFLIKPLHEIAREPIFNKSSISEEYYRIVGNIYQTEDKNNLIKKYDIGFCLE